MLRLAIALLVIGGSDALAPVIGARARTAALTRARVVLSESDLSSDVAPPVDLGLTEMSEMELAEQSAKLDALALKWRKRQRQADDEDGKRLGWAISSEQINGRLAMFFLIVGLVTEYYTGQSVPQQVGTMLQTLGVID
mmetsp:Transcript_37470/g.64360  ORF Transcript_37470/g.64360 Transcript_37470/m.64360 type:complete len:139 (+) Transcript_37470:57-473(+)